MINRATIAKMKDGARIVNAARGALIDEEALVEALQSGKLAGAALDVFSTEPYEGPLLGLDDVVVTPHLAASTDEAQDRAGVIIAEQVVAALDGGPRHECGQHPGRRQGLARGARAVSSRSRPSSAASPSSSPAAARAASSWRRTARSPTTTRASSRSRRSTASSRAASTRRSTTSTRRCSRTSAGSR